MSTQDKKYLIDPQAVLSSILEKGYYKHSFKLAGVVVVLKTLVMDDVMQSERIVVSKDNDLYITHNLTLNQLSYALIKFGDTDFSKPSDTLEWLKAQSSQLVEGLRRRFNALEDEVSKIVGNEETLADFFPS